MGTSEPQDDWYILDHGFEDDPENGFVLIYYRGLWRVRARGSFRSHGWRGFARLFERFGSTY